MINYAMKDEKRLKNLVVFYSCFKIEPKISSQRLYWKFWPIYESDLLPFYSR